HRGPRTADHQHHGPTGVLGRAGLVRDDPPGGLRGADAGPDGVEKQPRRRVQREGGEGESRQRCSSTPARPRRTTGGLLVYLPPFWGGGGGGGRGGGGEAAPPPRPQPP